MQCRLVHVEDLTVHLIGTNFAIRPVNTECIRQCYHRHCTRPIPARHVALLQKTKAPTSKSSSGGKPLKRSKTISGRPASAVDSSVTDGDIGRCRRDSLGGARSPRRPVLSRTQSQRVTSFFCPSCQSDIDLGEKGLRGLYRNFALEVIVDRFKLEVKKAMRVPCGSCKKSPAQDATKSCLDCKASFCNECFKRVHPWGTGRAQHEYIGPTHNYRPKTLMCTDHPDEKVTMYCEGCKKPICRICKFTGNHKQHKVSVIERKYTVQKNAGKNAKDELTSTTEKILTLLNDRKATLTQCVDGEVEIRLTDVAKGLKEAAVVNSSQVNIPSFSLRIDESLRNSDSMKYLEVPTAPTLNGADCRNYDDTYVKWNHLADVSGAVDTYTLEYRKHVEDKKPQPTTLRIGVDDVVPEHTDWLTIRNIKETYYVISGLDVDSTYQFKVRATNCKGDGPYSEVVELNTVRAAVPKLHWMTSKGNSKHSFVNISQDGQSIKIRRNFRGVEFDPLSPMVENPVHIINEKKLMSANHYWEIRLSDWQSVAHVGIVSEESAQQLRYRDNGNENGDHDSGHDSADESDQTESGPDYLSSVTFAKGMLCCHGNKKGGKFANRRISVVGVLLKSKEGKVTYSDATDRCVLAEQKCLTEGAVPAFTLWGEGSIHVNTIQQISC
ncbi:putative E3 ubiquitin-protein ligase Trim36 [Apostichopus japonicus]|uniref:Putative E3 ubiquitin-protein ligase Trim36 n=1 Tax=Stichopus japonicus TaxID=307972 RepID=A0A2G8K6S0_STIJA|nr:putative E3 ubiquitin-protein ligase Trim36 [Apostichopus japonicus]